jgi:hypothetical protein
VFVPDKTSQPSVRKSSSLLGPFVSYEENEVVNTAPSLTSKIKLRQKCLLCSNDLALYVQGVVSLYSNGHGHCNCIILDPMMTVDKLTEKETVELEMLLTLENLKKLKPSLR